MEEKKANLCKKFRAEIRAYVKHLCHGIPIGLN